MPLYLCQHLCVNLFHLMDALDLEGVPPELEVSSGPSFFMFSRFSLNQNSAGPVFGGFISVSIHIFSSWKQSSKFGLIRDRQDLKWNLRIRDPQDLK